MTADNSDTDESTTPETLTIEIPLDEAHGEMVRQEQDAGFDVARIVAAEIQPNAEQTIYNIFQSSKYETQDGEN